MILSGTETMRQSVQIVWYYCGMSSAVTDVLFNPLKATDTAHDL